MIDGKRLLVIAATTLLLVAACGSSSTPTPVPATPGAPATAGAPATPAGGTPAAAGSGMACVAGSITAAGSTALQPLVDAAGKQYVAACPGAAVNVNGGGSGTGLTQVLQGAVQIGDSDIFAEEKLQPADASQLVDHQVVRQGFVMVTNPGVTGVTNLTAQQATDIWTGKTTNWKDVGGPDQPIVLIIRPASSGTRATFRRIVLGGATEASGQALTEDSNGAIATAVTNTPGSTSYIGFAYYQSNKSGLNALQLDGVDASLANMGNGTYKLQAIGHMYTKGTPSGLTAAFIDYMLSPAVQDVLAPSLYYAPIGTGPMATPPISAPAPAGSAAPAASASPAP